MKSVVDPMVICVVNHMIISNKENLPQKITGEGINKTVFERPKGDLSDKPHNTLLIVIRVVHSPIVISNIRGSAREDK